MAKNWTAAEAIEAIKNNDKEAIMDIGKRFPLFAHFAACDAIELVKNLPEFITARKIEGILKGDVTVDDTDDDADEEVVEKKSKKKEEKQSKRGRKPAKKVEDDDDEDEDDADEDDENEEFAKPVKKSKKKE